MRCPKCQNRVAPFVKWLCWPGPRRTCLSCGSRLRYKNFYLAVGFHALLGAAWVFLNLPLWVIVVVLPITAVVYPWFFARYEPIA